MRNHHPQQVALDEAAAECKTHEHAHVLIYFKGHHTLPVYGRLKKHTGNVYIWRLESVKPPYPAPPFPEGTRVHGDLTMIFPDAVERIDIYNPARRK